jgi:murein DD-endopeptidase MepM/ murein hydrolase activator NlpD
MRKEKEILDILSLYESILKTKSINEVSTASSELFGGDSVSIPVDGAHGGQSGWQSANAWDIKASIGTPVYAVIGGTLKTYSDYGPTPIRKDGKTLFGVGFTVDSDDNLPDVYYTHLKDVSVRQGDKITCGQFLGYVMDFPGSDYDHLHIGVETGNVRQFLNNNGTLKCANGQSISGTTVTSGSSDKAYSDATKTSATPKSSSPFNASGVEKDDFLTGIAKGLTSKMENYEYEKDILKIYEDINIRKKSISKIVNVQEVALNSPLDQVSVNSEFGTRWGKEHNGVDLAANAAQVKSPADGVVAKVANDEYPCGGTIVIDHAGGFKTGFCHMQKINVSAGQQVKQGEVIGISGGGANDPGHGRSDGRHLHFTLRKDGQLVNPIDYINKDSVVMNGEPPKSSSTDSNSSSTSEKAYSDATKTAATPKSTSPFNASGVEKDSFLTGIAKGLTSKMESMQEQKKFGKDISNRYGRIIIPKDSNPKIKSPISGVIYNKRYSSSCVNQITILNTDNQKIYIQFCGISSPKVRDGQSISVGDTLGTTDSDVEVTMYDSSWSRIPIGSEGVDKYTEKKKDDKEKSKKKDDTNKYYTDPLTAIAAGVPGKILDKIFGDKYDEKTGEMTQKRWGGVADKQPVDPWLLDLIKSPFKSKKVTENIERIKKLL